MAAVDASKQDENGRVLLCVTGFGKFHGVSDNPTTQIVTDIQQLASKGQLPFTKNISLVSLEVLHVSRQGVRDGLRSIATRLRELWQPGDKALLVHFGVYSGYPNFRIECTGKNQVQWAFEDESGESQPTPAEVVPGGKSSLAVRLDATRVIDQICEGKEGGLSDLRGRIEETHDAGDFICNYCLYSSLHATGESASSASVFVHVPNHDHMPRDKQLHFALRLLQAASDQVADGTAATEGHPQAPAWVHRTAAAGTPIRCSDDDGYDGQVEGGIAGAADMSGAASGSGSAAASSGAEADDKLEADLAMLLDEIGSDEHVSEGTAGQALASSGGAGSLRGGVGGGEGDGTRGPPSTSDGSGVVSRPSVGAGSEVPAPAQVPAPSQSDIDAQFAASLQMAMERMGMAMGAGVQRQEGQKMVIVAREDLRMSPGKLAAQCCHAALAGYRQAQESDPVGVSEWVGAGEKIVVVRAKNEGEMNRVAAAAREQGLAANGVADAGRTEVTPGTRTVLAVGPARESEIDAVTGGLRLL